MEETNDVEALEKISSEVDESQIKVILSNQCIKAQAFLLDKLKKQSERHKETCGFIGSANLKLEAEIKQAELEISSMLISQETIRSANVEMKKEWLVAKVRKTEITERIDEGKKRYEALWLECKTRYESIPFIQNLLQATKRAETLNNEIDSLDKQATALYEEIKSKRVNCINLDIKRSIELAHYMIYEMPNILKIIREKSESINDITKQIEDASKEKVAILEDSANTLVAEQEKIANETNENEKHVTMKNDLSNDDDSLIPKLQFSNFDLDLIDVDLERVKMKKDEFLNIEPIASETTHDLETNNIGQYNKEENLYEYVISPYFNTYKENDSQNFSKRKLINILEDVHIDNSEAYHIFKKVNLENLRAVNKISSEVVENGREKSTLIRDKGNTPLESDTIEEVDIRCSNTDNIIIPPTQFLDVTLTSSQDGTQKKRVSFDIPSSLQINEIIEDVGKNDNDENETPNQTMNSQLDVSVASEDFSKIKDMILKKHNLDLSPQFVYAKNPVLQKRDDDTVVTSKFFQNDKKAEMTEPARHESSDDKMETDEQLKVHETEDQVIEHENLEEPNNTKDNTMPMDVDEMIVSSPKEKPVKVQKSEKPVPGLLFTHGAQAIPDSLNASLSTTGYDDSDFPHCIDSSLLLSPKAFDAPVAGDNADVLSQEVPNFLSGFRKTGFSFFGGTSTSEPNPDSSVQNDGNNFSFNFGGEKKNRGGLFNLFN